MKVSLEYLYHFRCDRCQQWWSRADIEPQIGEHIYCPYCGHTNTVEQVQTFRQHQFDTCLRALPDPKRSS